MMESTDEAPPVEQETTREMIPVRREGQLTQYRTYVPELDDETKGVVFYGFPYEHEFDRYSLHIPKASSNSKRSYSDITTDDSLHHKNLTEQAIFLHSLIATFPNERLDSAEFLTTFLAPFNSIHDIAIIINHKDFFGNAPLHLLCKRDFKSNQVIEGFLRVLIRNDVDVNVRDSEGI